MNAKRYITIAAAAVLMAATAAGQARTTITATLDSAYITMGNVTALNVEVVEPADAYSQVGFIPGTMPAEVEVIGEATSDTIDLGSQMRQINRRIILQSFDSGAYTLPPVLYLNGADTLLSNVVTLKVNPVDVSHLEDIHGNADIMSLRGHWYDFLPDWIVDYWAWLLLTLLLVGGGVCAVLILTNRVKVPFIPTKKPIPPYEAARRRLDTLHEQHLCERGQEREYYTELTDILREYIDRRFNINAMEMTSRQILDRLNANPETKPSQSLMRQILEVADFVKFAKMRPMPDDNVKSFNHAVEFLENTKPAEPEPAPEEDKTNN